jgi:hypothetical protein
MGVSGLFNHEWYMPNVEQGCITLTQRNLERSG